NSYFITLASLAVLFGLFVEAEANYEGLRIGGLVFAILLISAGIGFLLCKYCNRNKNTHMDKNVPLNLCRKKRSL
uniref:FXYD domain-containing ion transport regulator n=1 Tax=Haplochromis burtoni TaxID=8153 RepID=A0A3Q2WQA8_HAPBU